MTIELSKDARKEAIASIERYFRENMEERLQDLGFYTGLVDGHARHRHVRRRFAEGRDRPQVVRRPGQERAASVSGRRLNILNSKYS